MNSKISFNVKANELPDFVSQKAQYMIESDLEVKKGWDTI